MGYMAIRVFLTGFPFCFILCWWQFILYFNETCIFNKCISHDGLTKFWPFTQKCEYQGIMKLIKTRKSLNFLKLILTNSVFFFHVMSLFKHNDTCIKVSNFFNFHQDLVW
jgi:hypothetical protein